MTHAQNALLCFIDVETICPSTGRNVFCCVCAGIILFQRGGIIHLEIYVSVEKHTERWSRKIQKYGNLEMSPTEQNKQHILKVTNVRVISASFNCHSLITCRQSVCSQCTIRTHIHKPTTAIVKQRLTQHYNFWFILWGTPHVMWICLSLGITSVFQWTRVTF